jgi:putative ATP-dependent endonuclease of OLD family
MTNPYISKVRIKNFRNFLNTEVDLSQKQVVIGENNVGKTNFLRALQLILDKNLSDNDRELLESDFHDSLADPMKNGVEIEIMIQIRGYSHSRKLVAQFTDAIISSAPPTLQITYKYRPVLDEQQNIIGYEVKIYKGINEDFMFSATDRNFINIYVIKALRDVERELKEGKGSPLYKLVKQYEIAEDDLEEISEAMQAAADKILGLDEIQNIRDILQKRFNALSGLQNDYEISLKTFDVDTERLLYALQVYMGVKQRPVSELSLGLANILFVSLMLILIKDKTVPPILKPDMYETLLQKDTDGLLPAFYKLTERGNYILRENVSDMPFMSLYAFMDENNFKPQAFTILAVEEPESHLHPVLQRLIYREVLHKSETSVIFTSHSPYISSVAPISTIVHLRAAGGESKLTSSATLGFDQSEMDDLQRYLDARRGEMYFGKGVMLVEGISEEYIVPAAATLFGTPLEDHGIVVCNISSTNFKPYVKLLLALSIPFVAITDGDYFEVSEEEDEIGIIEKIRTYHIPDSGTDSEYGYRGLEIVRDLLVSLDLIEAGAIPDILDEQEILFEEQGFFVGNYTLEIDVMEQSILNLDQLKAVYSELVDGATTKNNFNKVLDEGRYWDALKKIESNIGKGRFAQRLAGKITKEMIPSYIQKAIESIIDKVKADHE